MSKYTIAQWPAPVFPTLGLSFSLEAQLFNCLLALLLLYKIAVTNYFYAMLHMFRAYFLAIPFLILLGTSKQTYAQSNRTFIIILGIAQDGGYPHIGCEKECCSNAWKNDSLKKFVVSLALVDSDNKKWWLFDATPDIKEQLHYFRQLTNKKYNYLPNGIFITHAHIGHYTGLMQFGREAMNTTKLPVYVLPKMKNFLENNGPWSQLVKLQNISLQEIIPDSAVELDSNKLQVIPFLVPHRDEYSETAGFKIITSGKKYLFIPDINKWHEWNKNIVDMVKQVDIALLDGTFYDSTELPGKRISQVPHPFVSETMQLFENENMDIRHKIFFIHLNHTNPLLNSIIKYKEIKNTGFNIAIQGEKV